MRAWALVALVVATACDRPGSPTMPSSSDATPQVVSAASLSLSQVRASIGPAERNSGYKFEYQVRFVLAETSGRSGATIQNVETSDTQQNNVRNRGCGSAECLRRG